MVRALLAASLLVVAGCPGGMNETKQDRGSVAKKDTATPADTSVDGSATKDGPAVDTSGCPPAPTCNWCNGDAVKDTKGCITAFKCANGVDPCKIKPCTKGSCNPAYYCDTNTKLCWKKKDSGIPDQGKKPPLCLNSNCKGAPGKSCDCDWSCTDGTKYKTTCTGASSGYSCTCYTNGVKSGTCTLTQTCYQSYVATCCKFLMQ